MFDVTRNQCMASWYSRYSVLSQKVIFAIGEKRPLHMQDFFACIVAILLKKKKCEYCTIYFNMGLYGIIVLADALNVSLRNYAPQNTE